MWVADHAVVFSIRILGFRVVFELGIRYPERPGKPPLFLLLLLLLLLLRALRHHRRSAVGNTWAGWGSIPVVFPWHGRPPVSHPTCDISCPPRRTGEYWKAMIPARPLYRGVRRSVWDPETSRARIGRSGPSCVLPKGVPQGQTESGGRVLAVICWSPSAQRRCNPTGRCDYRPSVTS